MDNRELTEQIIEIINTVFTARDISNLNISNVDSEQSNIDIDSITFISVVIALEEAFKIVIPDEKLLITEMNTISKMKDVVSIALGITGK